ncbi:fungal-specific transcription factor domain-containing protein [Boeremia exigua]|uniref:fungal-specific transcription factor domain-containing protein n=1 Tax=Boeremia exigua TaxID=749465 RepID=UPI001E8D6E4B|nr:fungal-specific transcription factor domain-containing protein [Boeremia exigua]KAH6614168.1 fungal-specific transcription factor domain-containing protein [Boeremia exigua]
MAEDITVLQQYLTSTTTEPRVPSRVYNTISTAPGGSLVVYLTVPTRRRGMRSAIDPGKAQREIIEHVLGSSAAEVRKAFFEHLHPCFPVLDEKTFSDMWRNDSDRISPALVCDLYASAQQVWGRSLVLSKQAKPDPHFIWNQAVTALQDDFMAPTISTVHAAVLDLLGRPVIGVTGNIVNAGRIVTLAQSLGLHRDPSSWKATDHEKDVRINLWWGVLIHDYWSSVGHGIPPTINAQYHDVPIPTFGLDADADIQVQGQRQVNATFVHLCRLSQILGDILPLVYSLRETPGEIKRRLRKIECALDDWVLALPGNLRPNRTAPCTVNGASNLWFAQLSLKVLVCRLSFKAVLEEPNQSSEARQYHLSLLRNAATEVADFMISLTDEQLQEFWMPYTSYLLVTAATILLRCTIESSDLATKKTCVTKLVAFRDRLRAARDTLQWDLADFCLERCDEPIQKIADAIGPTPSHLATADVTDQTLGSPSTEPHWTPLDLSSTSDLFLPVDSLDYPWETLWDGIEGPWSIQI